MSGLKAGKKKLNTQLPTLPVWCVALIGIIWVFVYLASIQLEKLLVISPYKSKVNTELQGEAIKFQQKFNLKVSNLIKQVEKVAAEPKSLEALLGPNEDQTLWQRKARTLDTVTPHGAWFYSAKLVIPSAERIFLLNPESDTFPLSDNFVAQLMYEVALKGDSPPPQAAKTDQWNIYIARPVFDVTHPVGTVLAEFTPLVFQDALQQEHVNSGRVSLIQAIPNYPEVHFYAKGSGWKEEYSVTLDTLVKDWKIKFTGSKQLVESVQRIPPLYYILLLTLIGIALVASVILIIKNLTFPKVEPKVSSRINPEDDLLTEKLSREKNTPPQPGASNYKKATSPPDKAARQKPGSPDDGKLPEYVFRDYDIRGKAGTDITEEFANSLGQVLGTIALGNGEHRIVLCADGRQSSPGLRAALATGILSTGCDLVDLGEGPTPLMNFALSTMDNCSSGVMVTASHNPGDDNGFKIISNNSVLSGHEIRDLRKKMLSGKTAKGTGNSHRLNLLQRYINRVVSDVTSPIDLKIAIDCGNGIASTVATPLFRALGCQITELFTDVDGSFPNHDPDPTNPLNLRPLVDTVIKQKLDLGLAFDGDGDRVVAVTGTGRIVWPDELLMIFARDIVTRNPGAEIVYDVKSTRRLKELISSYGGKPVMWKTGHAPMRNKVRETGAPVGGEFSGHLFFNDRWYGFDDGLYAAARLLEIINLREQSLEEIVSSFPKVFYTEEIRIPIEESRKKAFMEEFIARSNFRDAQLVTIDGLRAEYDHGWGLVRASNTSAALTLRFEADTADSLKEIINDFKSRLKTLDNSLQLKF